MTTGEDEAARRAYEERSFAELEAGRLPLRAQERLASMNADHAFTSDLSTAEHHAVRSVGFVPVGQVMGASVFQIGYTGGWDCGLRGAYGYRGGGMLDGSGRVFNVGGFSGAGMGGMGMGGMGMGGYDYQTVDVTPWRRALLEAQQRAVGRLEQEARALGADGVVAVRFRENHLGSGMVEFLVIGTAVRNSGPTHPAGRLFSCDLSGQDFAQLALAGYLPTGLLFGMAVMTRHDDWGTRMNQRSWANVELAGFTNLAIDTRAEARLALARAAASAGSTLAVLATHTDQVSEHECQIMEGGRDHVMRTTFVGTGVVEVGRGAGHDLPDALPIMRLSDRRPEFVESTR